MTVMFERKSRRRNRLQSVAFPALWRAILQRNISYCERLTPSERKELHGDIQVFIAEKNFEGCGGLEITEEIKVTIAAYACILLLNRLHDFYPRLQSILVYPDAYPAAVVRIAPGNIAVEGHEMRGGESWRTCAVVLSWNHVLRRPMAVPEGRNAALHEFSHQLDHENGFTDGAPVLPTTFRYATWARVLGSEFATLTKQTDTDQPTLVDKYGATEPAEFFAVVTEYFFEKSLQLQQRHP
jgi:Mlc titration factor MtfA (ptsG expression regulator)